MEQQPQTQFHFKTSRRIALDNNTLCAAFGVDSRIKEYARKAGISIEDVMYYCSINTLYENVNKGQRLKLNELYKLIKQARNMEIRFVIPPTVISEIYDRHIVFTPTTPNVFFHEYWVEHCAFDENTQMLIDELTHDLISPQPIIYKNNGREYTKIHKPIEGNHNQNHDHDARIFAESIMLGCDLFTFDGDFKNRQAIYQTVKRFEQKHPEIAGISTHVIVPNIEPQLNQKKRHHSAQEK